MRASRAVFTTGGVVDAIERNPTMHMFVYCVCVMSVLSRILAYFAICRMEKLCIPRIMQL